MNVEVKVKDWVDTLNAIDQEMIGKLMTSEPDDWTEVTTPQKDDKVLLNSTGMRGTVEKHIESQDTYIVRLKDNTKVRERGRKKEQSFLNTNAPDKQEPLVGGFCII